MTFITNLFKKKKKHKATLCSVCKSRMEYEEGFALTTAQVVISKQYWDRKMVEPETMCYTTAHFDKKDEQATRMRKIIFEKTAEKDQVWMACDSCVSQFAVDRDKAREFALQWWLVGKDFDMPGGGRACDVLDNQEYQAMREYATMQAGSHYMR